MTEKEKIRIQTSETFLLSAILALSGGFQDAYTYNVRNKVFSNAQTGNVVLMSQHLMIGEWMKGLSYLFPILSFALGVLVAERIGHRYKKAKRIHWRQIVVMIEIIILFVVGFIPHRYDMIATMLVSFSCSMQVQSFRKVNGYGYASTMCIGNLRSGTESLSIYLRDRNIGALKKDRALLWNYSDICNRSRYRRSVLTAHRNTRYMGFKRAACHCMYNDGQGTQINSYK